jgi:hypothetical protein
VENSAQLFFAEFSKRGGNSGKTCISFFHGSHGAAVSTTHPWLHHPTAARFDLLTRKGQPAQSWFSSFGGRT